MVIHGHLLFLFFNETRINGIIPGPHFNHRSIVHTGMFQKGLNGGSMRRNKSSLMTAVTMGGGNPVAVTDSMQLL